MGLTYEQEADNSLQQSVHLYTLTYLQEMW